MSGRRKGGQVTPPRTALAAGEITAPSLLARDVHKLCITASGAHMSEPREKRRSRDCDRMTGEGRGCDATLLAPGALPQKGLIARARTSGFRIGGGKRF